LFKNPLNYYPFYGPLKEFHSQKRTQQHFPQIVGSLPLPEYEYIRDNLLIIIGDDLGTSKYPMLVLVGIKTFQNERNQHFVGNVVGLYSVWR